MPSDDCCGSGCCGGSSRQLITIQNAHHPGRITMTHFTTTVHVDGMTCGHCVASVTEEIQSLDGVEGVSIDLNAGGVSEVTIDSDRKLKHESISEAVAEAGYVMVDNNA
ncbi:heavy-metal-associated domain-containing protein [Sinomonas sp. JC656]|uniref:Heavy-metal-associated domain-containing protein n=2 Tax=Sinomonas cellulolyticus TaxID=2801916 RepID=A0ABS1JXG9_9MICC|nr:heavy-metal-associated domain-containing protein [Sinomonas cellulolyticus]